MKSLTDSEYWDKRHAASVREEMRPQRPRRGVRRLLDAARIRCGAEIGAPYSEFLYEQKLVEHLPRRPDWSILELGCAPGRRLLRLCDRLGYQPWGVEYSPVGADATRRAFAERGVPADHVIESDMFDPAFQSRYAGSFDVVYSRGLIEHFDRPGDVVGIHVELARPGGFVVCSIPNVRGWAYPFWRYGAKDVFDAHNCDIMRLVPFRSLFDGKGLETTCCCYVGQISMLGIASIDKGGWTGASFNVLCRLENILSHAMFVLQRGRAVETRWSPTLLYIGRRTG